MLASIGKYGSQSTGFRPNCFRSSKEDPPDTIAYLQIKDLAEKNKDQVFIFNGWTFASTPTLKSVDHPIYDVWLVGCENV